MAISSTTCAGLTDPTACKNRLMRWNVGLDQRRRRTPLPRDRADCNLIGDLYHSTPAMVEPPVGVPARRDVRQVRERQRGAPAGALHFDQRRLSPRVPGRGRHERRRTTSSGHSSRRRSCRGSLRSTPRPTRTCSTACRWSRTWSPSCNDERHLHLRARHRRRARRHRHLAHGAGAEFRRRPARLLRASTSPIRFRPRERRQRSAVPLAADHRRQRQSRCSARAALRRSITTVLLEDDSGTKEVAVAVLPGGTGPAPTAGALGHRLRARDHRLCLDRLGVCAPRSGSIATTARGSRGAP